MKHLRKYGMLNTQSTVTALLMQGKRGRASRLMLMRRIFKMAFNLDNSIYSTKTSSISFIPSAIDWESAYFYSEQ